MIDKNGQTVRHNDLDVNAGSTRNDSVNARAIQIALVGNFNNEKPTEAQYKELNRVIKLLKDKNKGKFVQVI